MVTSTWIVLGVILFSALVINDWAHKRARKAKKVLVKVRKKKKK